MIRTSLALGLVSLVLFTGCKKDDDTETGETGETCTNSISETFPAQNATNAYYRGTVEVKLAVAEADATIAVADAAGAEVAGSVSVEGRQVVFTPSAPLAPSTQYTATVTYSCGEAPFSFTTSEVGGAADGADVEGSVYNLDLASGRFVQPPGVGALLQEYLDVGILIKVLSVEGTSIEMYGAISEDDGSQSTCDPTIPFPTADFSANPYFQVGPQQTTISVQGYSVTIDDLFVSGSFSPDADYIAGAVLKGKIDTRPLVPLLSPDGGEDEICNLATTIGVSCEDCGNGEVFCLSLHVDSIAAAGVDVALQQQHEPTAESPAEGSINYCTLEACAAEEECAAL